MMDNKFELPHRDKLEPCDQVILEMFFVMIPGLTVEPITDKDTYLFTVPDSVGEHVLAFFQHLSNQQEQTPEISLFIDKMLKEQFVKAQEEMNKIIFMGPWPSNNNATIDNLPSYKGW